MRAHKTPEEPRRPLGGLPSTFQKRRSRRAKADSLLNLIRTAASAASDPVARIVEF